MMDKKITVEISLDGPRVIQRPCPSDWDNWTDDERQVFIHSMEREIIGSTVAFTVFQPGEDL